MRIAKKPDGEIVFVEIGNERSGWQHIRKNHANDFFNKGISEDQILDAVMTAVVSGRILGIQGRSRSVYRVEFNGATQYISVDVGSNGYIVSANPTPQKLIGRFTLEE